MISDSEIWLRFLGGDDSAFEYIYNTHFDFLISVGRVYESDIDVVKDCIQELFTKLYIDRKKLPYCQNVKSYLSTSLRNKIFNYKKNKSNSQLEYIDDIENSVLQLQEDLVDLSFTDEEISDSNKLLKIYNKLTDKQRQIIYLRLVEKLPYKDIAEYLNIESQSAKNSMARVLEKIKKEFLLYTIMVIICRIF